MRLIDADALIEKIHIMPDTANKFSFEHLVMTYAPTIDAEPVVRCKDCKYSIGKSFIDGKTLCILNDAAFNPDEFCPYGKRKDDDE